MYLEGFALVFGFLGILFLALLIVHPLASLASKRLDPWPWRPMDNHEKKAAWAARYHQATRIETNTHPWPWNKGRTLKGK